MMKSYKNITDSKIDWLGEVPNEWIVVKLKYALADVPYPIVDGPFGTQLKADEYTDSGVPLVRISNLDFKGNLTLEDIKFISEQKALEIQRSRIKLNDIIIGKTGATIGKSGLNDKIEYGVISSSCLKISVDENKLLPHFFKYYVTSANFQNIILQTASGSTRDTINITPMANLEVVIPTKQEQIKIAHYLDTQTATIDQLIHQKEKLIELLKEKRQAVINEAVTKGLNPNAKMKDSGIEWLGQVPKHWSIVKSKFITSLITDGAHISPDLSSSDFPFVSTVDLNKGEIDWSNCLKTSKECYEYLVTNGCKPLVNDILYSKDGTIGKTTVIEEETEFVVASSLIIVRPDLSKINPFYFEYLLRSYIVQFQIESVLSGVALRRISLQKFSNLILVIPPLQEQNIFLNTIHKDQIRFKETLVKQKNQIELLKEYRQSIISEAVTGKIDVRDWQPNKQQVA